MHPTTSNATLYFAAVMTAGTSAPKALEYLLGLGTLDERMLILVDIDKLISSDEMRLVEKIAA